MRGTKGDAARLFSVMSNEKARGTGHKLKYKEFHLNTGRNFFTIGVIKHQNRLPGKDRELQSLQILKIHSKHGPEQTS